MSDQCADDTERTTDWFDALGNPVPFDRRALAAEKARGMGLSLDGEEEVDYIGGIAEAIENDRPNEAIAKAREKLDLTGTYRLLAYLCVECSVGADAERGGDSQ